MFKRCIATLLATAVLAVGGLASAQEATVLDKLNVLEKTLYGSEQTGAMLERVQKVEKDVNGQANREALIPRVDAVYEEVLQASETSPSLLLKVNAVEWALKHRVNGTVPVKSRLEDLEHTVTGNVVAGAFQDRTAKLLALAYADAKAQTSPVTLAKDSLVKISLLTALDSRTARVGDVVQFQAADDVYVNGVLAIARGAEGTGKVGKVERAGNFGRDAKLEIAFETIETIDAGKAPVYVGEKAKTETKSLAKAAGATVAGLIILGPVGVIGGAFVHGDDIKTPVGAQMFIQTNADTAVIGVLPPGSTFQ